MKQPLFGAVLFHQAIIRKAATGISELNPRRMFVITWYEISMTTRWYHS